jgi:hypothetical protein
MCIASSKIQWLDDYPTSYKGLIFVTEKRCEVVTEFLNNIRLAYIVLTVSHFRDSEVIEQTSPVLLDMPESGTADN